MPRPNKIVLIAEIVPPDFPNARCRGRTDLEWVPDNRYAHTHGTRTAIGICCQCPHMLECAAYAGRHHLPGIWGGLTTSQREAMARL